MNNLFNRLGFGYRPQAQVDPSSAAIAQGPDDDVPAPGQQFAQFGAGCVWGVELAYQRVPGVTKTEVGYSHGLLHNPDQSYHSITKPVLPLLQSQHHSDETNPLPEGFETAGDRGIVIPWCCEMTVLSHDSVGGFLTHCGWNSILETIWCEVPVLCFPLLTDQVTNRKLVVDDWEIGINLCEDKSDFGRDEVGRNINRLMCGVSKEKIGRVKMSLEGAVRNSGSSSEMNLGLFIDGLLSKVGLSNGKASI
ncbi:Peptide methionine sulfoxide reductase MsrA [Arabidopsis suecica]|uniref:Peptide methionine sulfoxide reductase MsrA n=1 Tax=Arabidopsis suecica TaxID=45249 RepID=A0A8T1YNQ5_ARASU|nr:Peptide methionine sulfoxide reductase MsrA [Arabidopsis suecica]